MRDAKAKRLPKLTIGWREYVALPAFGLIQVKAKIDTGARTTALHASQICTDSDEGALWVSFHPEHLQIPDSNLLRARVHDIREVTNTSGVPERRIIILTPICLAGRTHEVEVSLADRADMTFPMIIGRTALRTHRLIVDSTQSWRTFPEARLANQSSKP